MMTNKKNIAAPVSFYSLKAEISNNTWLEFSSLKGKKVMIVNTASDCGYTAQYAELQRLYHHSKEDLEIIAFPSNDFGEQEKGSNEEIREFCINLYSIRFPVAKKSVVKKQTGQHSVFEWLTSRNLNGWNEQQPTWNFSKYIINEEGMLTHYFDPAVSPVSEEMIKAVHG